MKHLVRKLEVEFIKVLVCPNMDDEVLPFLHHVPYALTGNNPSLQPTSIYVPKLKPSQSLQTFVRNWIEAFLFLSQHHTALLRYYVDKYMLINVLNYASLTIWLQLHHLQSMTERRSTERRSPKSERWVEREAFSKNERWIERRSTERRSPFSERWVEHEAFSEMSSELSAERTF